MPGFFEGEVFCQKSSAGGAGNGSEGPFTDERPGGDGDP